MQALTGELHESFRLEVGKNREQNRLLRFDGRTLVAVGAIALSITGYVLQDARNTSKRDAEIETTKARVTSLERIAATNTEGRIRTEVELGELREGQAEIKALIQAHDSAGKKSLRESSFGSGEIGWRWSVSDGELSVLQTIRSGFSARCVGETGLDGSQDGNAGG
jgi:hypothetical protein